MNLIGIVKEVPNLEFKNLIGIVEKERNQEW